MHFFSPSRFRDCMISIHGPQAKNAWFKTTSEMVENSYMTKGSKRGEVNEEEHH